MTCACGGTFVGGLELGTPVRRCDGCGRLFLDRADRCRPFAALTRRFTPESLSALQRAGQARLEALQARAPEAPLYADCPVCRRRMGRRAFSPRSGIVLQECAEHGTLGEPGWLAEAVAFVEGGGEVLALQDQVRRLSARRRELERQAGQAEEPSLDVDWLFLVQT
ncbi:MAG TPA: hypothetical protein VIV59_04120 [Anaeromyxobacteraceae bacterium]